jgi:hypothetical protein
VLFLPMVLVYLVGMCLYMMVCAIGMYLSGHGFKLRLTEIPV